MLMRASPRPAWAGAFLLLAALARPETFIVLAVGAATLAVAMLREPRPPAGRWLVMIGWLALPIMCLHDLLLTGDPLWWLSVAPHAVAVNGGRARSLAGTMLLTFNHLRSMWVLATLATAGGVLLLARRAWVAVAGLVALGPLVFVYVWVLSAGHIQVIPHYFHPADMAIIVAAGLTVGIGLELVRKAISLRVRWAGGLSAVAISTIVAVLLAVAASHPFAPLSAAARASIGGEAAIDSRVAALLPAIQSSLPARAAEPVRAAGPMGSPDPASVVLFIPAHRLPRMSVDLDLPPTQVAVISPGRVDLAAGYPPVDSVVYLDGVIDPASVGPQTAVLRVSAPSTIGGVEVVPVVVDPSRKIWIVAIRRAP